MNTGFSRPLSRMLHFGLLAVTAGAWMGVAVADETLPKLPKNVDYTEARRSLLALNWQPAKLDGADVCQDGDGRCQGRPEMFICAGSGQATCIFTWKHGDTLIEVLTTGEMPVVAGIRCRAGC